MGDGAAECGADLACVLFEHAGKGLLGLPERPLLEFPGGEVDRKQSLHGIDHDPVPIADKRERPADARLGRFLAASLDRLPRFIPE